MSFTYFKFLFVNVIKRKPVWIVWFLFLFTCTSFIIILPAAATMNTLQVWSNTTMTICQTFMGMVAGLFTAVLAINIFKDTNEEGTELIVASKPVSRFKLVSSKFLLFGFFCLLINLSAVIISLFTIFLPRTESKFYWGLVISMFIGNAVTFGIFGSISVLLTLRFAKVGIIVVNILISIVLLIYQILTLFVFSTPIKALTDRKMAANSYITHTRNSQTGEYKEEELVKFVATPYEDGQERSCQAKDWQGMVDYWTNEIKAIDPSPILNATDIASQIALTYTLYKTNEYSLRQSNRTFGISRFYNYNLTSPASPEIISGVDNKKSLPWLYTTNQTYDLGDDAVLRLPETYAFDGVKSLSGTSWRGYGDEIPVADIRSKEILASTDVFFESEDWIKYGPIFDNILYSDLYSCENYLTEDEIKAAEPATLASAFHRTDKYSDFYDNLWEAFVRNKEQLDINTVSDLNSRICQFKNYAYWQLVDIQSNLLLKNEKPSWFGSDYSAQELEAKTQAYNSKPAGFSPLALLLATVSYDQPNGGWMMTSVDGQEVGLLNENSQTVALNYLYDAWDKEKVIITDADDLLKAKLQSPLYLYLLTQNIFRYSLLTNEQYLFTSLELSTRSNKFTSRQYFVSETWYPNLAIFKVILGEESVVPIGQNIMLFYYKSEATLQFWVFAVLWLSISIALYGTGIALYNKYDIK